jgi:hypothetical protein
MRFRVPEYVSWYPLNKTAVLLDLRSQQRHCLQGTAALLWLALQQHASDEELADLLVERHGICAQTASQDVARWLEELLQKRLLYAVEG